MTSIINELDANPRWPEARWLFVAENLALTGMEIERLAYRYAAKLKSLGIDSQSKVGLVFGNTSDYVALLIAIWRLNAIAVPLRPRVNKYLESDHSLYKCNQVCDFRLIIYADSASPSVFSGWMEKPGKCALSMETFKATAEAETALEGASPADEEIAVLQFSSGSTGQPKAVIVTHAMVMAQLRSLHHNHIQFRQGEAVASSASWLPVNHDMGLFIGVLKPLHSGCNNILAPPEYYIRNPARWYKLLSEHHVDLTFTTNSALISSLNAIQRLQRDNGVDLSKLHLYIAAEKVSPIILKRCYKLFPLLKMPLENIHIGYGMAENALGCTCTRTPRVGMSRFLINDMKQAEPVADNVPNSLELVSVGSPDQQCDITIRDADDNPLPELCVGEINIKSPCISPGYYNNSEASRKQFTDGRFHSGDLGFFYQGELYFLSRQDDMITVGGRNIIPDDVEELVEGLDFVKPTASCLISTENYSTGGTQLVLLLEANSPIEKSTAKRYSEIVQGHLFSAMELLVSSIVFCAKGSIEKTSSGKKRRKIIRQRYITNQLEQVGILDEIKTTV